LHGLAGTLHNTFSVSCSAGEMSVTLKSPYLSPVARGSTYVEVSLRY